MEWLCDAGKNKTYIQITGGEFIVRQTIAITLLLSCIFPPEVKAEDKSLSLMEAIKTALVNNRDLQYKAQYDLKIAASNYQAALADYKLQSNFEINASRSEDKIFSPLDTIKKSRNTKYFSDLTGSWKFPAWLGSEFKLFSGIDLSKADSKTIQETTTLDKKYTTTPHIGFEWKQPLCASGIKAGHASLVQAKANYDIARLSYQQTREELILNVITAYYRLVSQKNQVELAREELRLTHELLTLSQAKLEADQIARLNLMQVQVQASSDEARLIAAENSLKSSKIAFYRLLNLPTQSKALIPLEVLDEPVIFNPLDGLSKEKAYEETLKNRADVKQQQINIALARLNLEIQKSKNKPALTLMGRQHWKGDKKEFEDIDKDMNRSWEVSASLNFPLLDGGLIRENIKAADLNLERAIYSNEELIRNIADEIDQLFENILAEKRRLDILNLNLKLAEEGLKITKLKYQEGMETANEVLRSQVSLFQMKNSINEAKMALFINKANLLKSMGRLEIEYQEKAR